MATDTASRQESQRADGRPTEPVDYAALNATYTALMAAVVLATRKNQREDPITGAELVPLAAATFALAKVIAKEKIGTWVREPFVEHEGTEPQRIRGRRLQRAVGELLTCTRCVGAWSALGVVGLRMANPPAGRMVTSVLAASAGNDFLQAGFSWLCARSDNEAEA